MLSEFGRVRKDLDTVGDVSSGYEFATDLGLLSYC